MTAAQCRHSLLLHLFTHSYLHYITHHLQISYKFKLVLEPKIFHLSLHASIQTENQTIPNKPNQTKPNQTKPNQTKPNQTKTQNNNQKKRNEIKINVSYLSQDPSHRKTHLCVLSRQDAPSKKAVSCTNKACIILTAEEYGNFSGKLAFRRSSVLIEHVTPQH